MLYRDAGHFSNAAGEREMAPKCGSLPRDVGDLVGLTWECAAIPGSSGSVADLPGRRALCSAGTSRLSVPSVRLSTVGSRTSSDNPIQTSSSDVLAVRLLMLTV